jgi:hypothetical protein
MSRVPWTIGDEREALRSVLNEITGTQDAADVMWGASTALLRLREYADWNPTTDDAEPCAYMGCEHPREAHQDGGCVVERMDYYERRFTRDGDRKPPRMRPCGCPEWRERTRIEGRLPREVAEEAAAAKPDPSASEATS